MELFIAKEDTEAELFMAKDDAESELFIANDVAFTGSIYTGLKDCTAEPKYEMIATGVEIIEVVNGDAVETANFALGSSQPSAIASLSASVPPLSTVYFSVESASQGYAWSGNNITITINQGVYG